MKDEKGRRPCGFILPPSSLILYLLSTSFQNSAAGLELIVSRVVNERRNWASRSRWKSHLISLSGIPRNGERSDTAVPAHHKRCSGIPRSGDRSVTCRQ